jgi:CubicO group peptidase (beta-lactamase class C family)
MVAALDPDRWQKAVDLAAKWVADGQVTALSLVTGTAHHRQGPVHLGSLTIDRSQPLPAQPIYLVASITKPIVVMGYLQLVEQGLATLSQRVIDVIPEFGRQGKNGIEARHLMTHTSGLPDMLPNNLELRAAHAPLEQFLAGVCDLPLSFPPGRGVQYQSTGLLVLAEMMQRISGASFQARLQQHVFQPLQMFDTSLGLPESWISDGRESRIAEVRLPTEQQGTDWHWNTRYWRSLGAPWGGLLTTAEDLSTLAQALLRQGVAAHTGTRVWSTATVAAAARNQLTAMRDVPEEERRCRPWGLGWRLNWPAHSANFGDLLSPDVYGHWGATGTLLWIEPSRGLFTVILTTEPQEPAGYFLSRLSNAVAAAWI